MKSLREILAAAALLFTVVTAATSYSTLSQRIPTHFNAAGVADGWGDKSSLWMLVAVACFLYVVLTLVRFLPSSLINVPVAQEQRAAAIPISLEMIEWVKAETICMFAFIVWTAVAVVQGRSLGLGAWFLPVTLLAIFGTIAFYLTRIMRLKNVDGQEKRG
jgi:uncharacterized membrane protein